MVYRPEHRDFPQDVQLTTLSVTVAEGVPPPPPPRPVDDAASIIHKLKDAFRINSYLSVNFGLKGLREGTTLVINRLSKK